METYSYLWAMLNVISSDSAHKLEFCLAIFTAWNALFDFKWPYKWSYAQRLRQYLQNPIKYRPLTSISIPIGA